MTVNIFFLLLVSHVLGDVVFTSYRLAVLKRNSEPFNQVLAIGCHAGVHAFFAGLLVFVFGGLWLRAALLVLALHFLIDFLYFFNGVTDRSVERMIRNSPPFSWFETYSPLVVPFMGSICCRADCVHALKTIMPI